MVVWLLHWLVVGRSVGWLVGCLTEVDVAGAIGGEVDGVVVAVGFVVVVAAAGIGAGASCCFVAAKQKHLWNVKTWFP